MNKFRPWVLAVAWLTAPHAPANERSGGIEVSAQPIAIAEYCPAAWPRSSMANQEEGTVGLLVHVAADGTAKDVTLWETSGFRTLDNASKAAARACRYVPAEQNGGAVDAWFRLQHFWKAGLPASPISNRPPCTPPPWPREALLGKQQGNVTVQLLVEVNGEVTAHQVLQSSGHPALDKAAAEGLAKCWFRPLSQNGKPAKAWQKTEYRWVLE
jgi:TonB family protein